MLDQETQKRISRYVALWKSRIIRTESIVPESIISTVKRRYEVSGLKEPRVVIVPSPVVAVLAGGIAAGIWQLRKYGGNIESVFEHSNGCLGKSINSDVLCSDQWNFDIFETVDPVEAALQPIEAFYDSTMKFLDDMKGSFGATFSGTGSLVHRLVRMTADSTNEEFDPVQLLCAGHVARSRSEFYGTVSLKNYYANFVALTKNIASAVRTATNQSTADLGYPCPALDESDMPFIMAWASRHWRCHYQNIGFEGLNSFGWVKSVLADICGATIQNQRKFAAWEECRIHGGPRMEHDEFCIISDFPGMINLDSKNCLHSEYGEPSVRWKDGWQSYHWHGIELN